MKYISIKMACSRFSVSHSTISRLVKKIKSTDNRYKGEKILTHTTLNNKVKKTLILTEYLESIYASEVDNDTNGIYQNTSTNTDSRLLDIMDRQLMEKDKQIENLQYLLLQSQKRLEVFDKMLKISNEKRKDIIINEVDDIDDETPITTHVEVNEVNDDIHDEVEVIDMEEEMVLEQEELVMDEEEERYEKKKLSFMEWIEKSKYSSK